VVRDVLFPEQLRQLRKQSHMAIWETDEPVHRHLHQSAHKQLAPHGVRTADQHHLRVKRSEVRFGSSTLVNVAFGPTNVGGITASMIACDKGMGNSLGGVKNSRSSVS